MKTSNSNGMIKPRKIVGLEKGLTMRFHHENRSGYQSYFVDHIAAEPGSKGIVLDIGCGPKLPSRFQPLASHWSRLDGLDPNQEEVDSHPDLSNRWASTLEDAEIPCRTYDLAYSYNVNEHVADPARFSRRSSTF